MTTREILNSHPISNLKKEIAKVKKELNVSGKTKAQIIDMMLKFKKDFSYIKMYEGPGKGRAKAEDFKFKEPRKKFVIKEKKKEEPKAKPTPAPRKPKPQPPTPAPRKPAPKAPQPPTPAPRKPKPTPPKPAPRPPKKEEPKKEEKGKFDRPRPSRLYKEIREFNSRLYGFNADYYKNQGKRMEDFSKSQKGQLSKGELSQLAEITAKSLLETAKEKKINLNDIDFKLNKKELTYDVKLLDKLNFIQNFYKAFDKIKYEAVSLDKDPEIHFQLVNMLRKGPYFPRILGLIEKDLMKLIKQKKKSDEGGAAPQKKKKEVEKKKPFKGPELVILDDDGNPSPMEVPKKSIEQVIDLYNKKKLDEPVPFLCTNLTDNVYLSYIMGLHNNDCYLPKLTLGLDRKGNLINEKIPIYKGKPLQVKKKFTEPIPFDEVPEKLAKLYLRCAKQNKIVAVRVNLDFGEENHANIFLLNPFRKEAERFEPHGAMTGSIDNPANPYGMRSKILDTRLQKLVDDINKFLPTKKEHLKFIPPKVLCPFLGPQAYEAVESTKGTFVSDLFPKGVEIGKQSDEGYCCVYSYMYLDVRMNTPKKSGKEIMDFIKTNILDKEAKNMKKMIRGLTKDLYEFYIKFLRKFKDFKTDNQLLADVITGFLLNQYPKDSGRALIVNRYLGQMDLLIDEKLNRALKN